MIGQRHGIDMSTGATTRSGLLQLTNGTAYRLKLKGHAFHPTPLQLRDSPNGSVQSFSVAFVVRIVTVCTTTLACCVHGMAFFCSS